jgi:hypothetical protein
MLTAPDLESATAVLKPCFSSNCETPNFFQQIMYVYHYIVALFAYTTINTVLSVRIRICLSLSRLSQPSLNDEQSPFQPKIRRLRFNNGFHYQLSVL